MNAEIARFYDLTFADEVLQKALLPALDLESFKSAILLEARRRGFDFTREQLDDTFDGLGLRDTFSHIDFGSPWISKIMGFGWVPKGYTRS